MADADANTYLPYCQCLLELQDAADRIFKGITNQVGLERQQLNNLSARIFSAQAKVDAISGTKRATTIFSSAKFPQVDPSVADFVSLFEGTKRDPSKSSADTVTLSTGQWQSQEEGTLELFQFFSETSHEYWLKDHKHQDGIGKVPPRTKSVADVLLFNSTELPYHKFRVVDNLAGVDQPVSQEELEVKPAALPAAPQSVLAGDAVLSPGAEEFGFRPVLRQVPSFSLPSVLPHLPMVAEISWSGMSGGLDRLPSIAPSAIHGGPFSPTSNYTASPRFDTGAISTRFDPASASARVDPASVPTRSNSSPMNGSIQKDKDILPRAPPQEDNTQDTVTRSGSSGSSSLSPAPSHRSVREDAEKGRPPPPPPPIPPPPAKVSQGATGSSAGQSLPAIDSQRAALMSSIRSSGIDLLRKTGRAGTPKASSETFGSSSIGGRKDEVLDKMDSPIVKQPINVQTVMAEMTRSLTLRRLSMRGASHDQGATRSDKNVTSIDEGEHSSGSGESSKLTLPNLQAHATQKSEQSDDDDDWED